MRIAIWAGNYQYWGFVHPSNLTERDGNQMGGSEAAVLAIAQELAKQGEEVLLGCQVGLPETLGSLRVCPFDIFMPAVFASRFDALVSWDDTLLFRYNLHHIPVKIVCYQLNDTQVGVLDKVIDRYFHPSLWHAQRFSSVYGVPATKQVWGLTNGTDPAWFTTVVERQNWVVWASSPDRGLHHLLSIWPEIIREVPDAHLHVFYDMDKWLSIVDSCLEQGKILNTTERGVLVRELLREQVSGGTVTYHGGVARRVVFDTLAASKVLAYPCDPVTPTEGFSMTTMEGWASGTMVLVSDADALPSIWGDKEGISVLPLPFNPELWTRQIVKTLRGDVLPGPRKVPKELTWGHVASLWTKEIRSCLTGSAS